MAGDALDFTLLPEDLRPLAPLIAKYAENDDVARSELLESASTDELRALSTAPEPHWDAINAFLDTNIDGNGPTLDVALALDSFSQAAMEAVYELEAREG